MHKIKSIFFVVLFSLISQSIESKILSMHSLKNLIPLFKQVQKDNHKRSVLLAFDLCNTLITPDNHNGWASDHWLDAHAKRLINELGIEPAKAWNALLPIYYETQKHPHFIVRPVEHDSLKVFNTLTTLADVTIGLTARSVPITLDTLRLLERVGFSFKESSKKIVCNLITNKAYYKDGVIFCGSYNKGLALVDVLNISGYWPEIVIFVDDKLKNLEAVEKALLPYGTVFIGVHYVHLQDTVENFKLDPTWGCLN